MNSLKDLKYSLVVNYSLKNFSNLFKIPVIFGIIFNSLFDFKYNFYGLYVGLGGAIISSFYQVVS
jgi:hypothetical protein